MKPLFRSKDPRRLFRGTSKVSKILRAPAKELEWDSDQVIDAVVKVGLTLLIYSVRHDQLSFNIEYLDVSTGTEKS